MKLVDGTLKLMISIYSQVSTDEQNLTVSVLL